MAKLESLGIRKIESLLYYVDDLERVRRFFLDKLDFAEIGVSSPELETEGRQKSAVFQAGGVTLRDLPARRRRRARVALAAQAPRGRGHDRVRGRGHREHVQAARRARRHDDHRHPALQGRRRRRWRCSASPRRSATRPSASSSATAIARSSPGSSSTPSPSAARNRSASRRSITSRPTSRRWRRRCCGWSTCSASSASGRCSSTPATSPRKRPRARG